MEMQTDAATEPLLYSRMECSRSPAVNIKLHQQTLQLLPNLGRISNAT